MQKKDPNKTALDADNRRKRRKTARRRREETHRIRNDAPKKIHKKHREGGISGDLIYVLAMVIAIVAAVGFSLTSFFEIRTIQVVGNQHTLASEVRAASGIQEGDKLWFINRYEIQENIFAQLSYVDEIRIKQIPPDTVVLQVAECQPVAAIASGGVYYVIDKNCKLLEYYPITQPNSYPIITGVTVQNAIPGRPVEVDDDLRAVSLKAIVENVLTNEIVANQISELNMEKLFDVYFYYDGRLRVNLGEADELEQKIQLFAEVVEKLEPTDKGTVSLKSLDTITFLPE